jgi:hypothetical protein
MAWSDYQPDLAWFADSNSDLDAPTGTTPSNPHSLTSPTLTGSPDSYADFDGADSIGFTPGTPVLEVGTGDVTIVARIRVDSFVAQDYIWENYDGSGTTTTAVGYRIKITRGSSRCVALTAPPGSEATNGTGFILETPVTTLTAGTDFIIAFRRSGGTWSLWLDADGTGGMTAATPANDTIGNAAFTECGLITFGEAGQTTSAPFDGRIYWLLGFPEAISDTDLGSTDWETESNLKDTWFSTGGITGNGDPVASVATVSGTGVVRHSATGDMTVSVATATGAGTVHHTGTGALTVSVVEIAGAASLNGAAGNILGAGDPTPTPATASGAARRGSRDVPGEVALVSGTPTVSGTGTVGQSENSTGSGSFASLTPTIAGSAQLRHGSAGVLNVTGPATVAGAAVLRHTASGALTVAKSFVAGTNVVSAGGGKNRIGLGIGI